MTKHIIRLAQDADIEAITELLQRCAEAMSSQGMHHWLGVYDQASVAANLNKKSVYMLEKDQRLMGCIALGRDKADYYQDCWPEAPAAEFYITQLAVEPDVQGNGYGKQLVQYCLDIVGDASVQLDAVDHYPALIQFYQSLGFEIIATGIGLGDKRHLLSLKR